MVYTKKSKKVIYQGFIILFSRKIIEKKKISKARIGSKTLLETN